jgi:glutamine synthetase
LLDAIQRSRNSADMRELLGEASVDLYSDIKSLEHDAYQQVISPWERLHLLLNV